MYPLNPRFIWSFYIVGMTVILSSFLNINSPYLAMKMILGTLLIFIAWLAVLLDVVKHTKENKVWWLLGLLFAGGITIPVYLVTQQSRLNKNSSLK